MIRLAQRHATWVLGCEDATWWSRLAQPQLHAWTAVDHPLRLVEQTTPKDDPDPKALACYGLVVRQSAATETVAEEVWLRCVTGRPVSPVTTAFLAWCTAKLEQRGITALLLVWDNASWHRSREVRRWLGQHNRQVKQTGQGVRIVVCPLPSKSPWLNPMEPHWVHGKRHIVEADGLLTAHELATRVCAYFQCPYEEHLTIPEKVP